VLQLIPAHLLQGAGDPFSGRTTLRIVDQ
jgi:hypothetical protein